MSLAPVMSEPKRRKPGPSPDPNARKMILGVRGLPEYRAWAQALANEYGISVSDLIAMGLERLADERGFRKPPKR